MNARIIRMKKEARALFWPWCVVVTAAVLPVVLPAASHHIPEAISFLGFIAGIPLLAVLALGNEFQYRTLSLWLSQPCGRMQLWAEKLIVSFAAAVLAFVAYALGSLSFIWTQRDFKLAVAAIVWVIVTVASATFWTLAARSTLGGLALSTLVFEFAVFVLFGPDMEQALSSASNVAAISALGICYAGLMLWLGARKLARFQVTGGGSGDDLLMTGPAVLPGVLAGWFRCRPSGAFLNLIRKEFRLLRPLWLIALLVVVYLACLAMFRRLPDLDEQTRTRAPITLSRVAQFLPVVLFPYLMAILAGALSLGEERTSGTQAWHMTLPVSARRQWLIKLGMALLAGLVCAVLLPLLVVIAVGSIFGSPFMFVHFPSLQAWLFLIPVLTLASFWCACVANGTVRAALWVFPVTIVIYFAGTSGLWLGQELARTTGTLKDLVVSWFHLSPLSFPIELSSPTVIKRGISWPGPWRDLFLAFVPAILFGAIQSYRLFRKQPPDSALWMLRCLLPLATVSLVWCLSLSAGFASSRWEPFVETREAIDKLQPGTAKLELAGEDLAKGAELTGLTRRWLRGSRIIVAPDKAHSSGYLATIHLPSGLECRLAFGQKPGVSFPPALQNIRSTFWERPYCVSNGP